MGRIEILTGVERRRDWSDDDKLSILEETAVAGARIVDVARRHDIHPQQIYTWRRKFAATRTNPVVSFLPVALIASEPTSEAERPNAADKPTATKRSGRPTRIEIGCKGGRVLKVEADIAPDMLKALIRSVEEA
jgi:transposase